MPPNPSCECERIGLRLVELENLYGRLDELSADVENKWIVEMETSQIRSEILALRAIASHIEPKSWHGALLKLLLSAINAGDIINLDLDETATHNAVYAVLRNVRHLVDFIEHETGANAVEIGSDFYLPRRLRYTNQEIVNHYRQTVQS